MSGKRGKRLHGHTVPAFRLLDGGRRGRLASALGARQKPGPLGPGDDDDDPPGPRELSPALRRLIIRIGYAVGRSMVDQAWRAALAARRKRYH